MVEHCQNPSVWKVAVEVVLEPKSIPCSNNSITSKDEFPFELIDAECDEGQRMKDEWIVVGDWLLLLLCKDNAFLRVICSAMDSRAVFGTGFGQSWTVLGNMCRLFVIAGWQGWF
ncbi:unnamed protein product [Vicia faba]|uniref:Uncharacterized protein n=1 Tax=Vicia faba TaxID=3906 RepID=A0AAV1AGD3_VICFA|nr:unnamed protein product [Vicia faba]